MAVTGAAVTAKLLNKSSSWLSRGFLCPVTAIVERSGTCRLYSANTVRPHPERKRQGGEGDGKEFIPLEIPGFNIQENMKDSLNRGFTKREPPVNNIPPPRYKRMSTDQDWTSVWPTAETFKASVVPLPVRQGVVFGMAENDGLSPEKYGNAELMKIPNFLHLTPKHIKEQCAAIKEFCTPWPEELKDDKTCEEHFPISIKTTDYVFDGASLREPEARRVTLQIRIPHLGFDYHAKDKLRRLVGSRFDEKTGILTLVTDRCPSRKQNLDYALYLLTVLNFESRKTEQWESEKTVDDMEKYVWELMPSKRAMFATLEKAKQAAEANPDSNVSDVLKTLPEKLDDKVVEDCAELKKYRDSVTELQNEGETLERLDEYKKAVRKLLIG